MVVFVTAHNLDWVAEYIEKVPAIVRSYGGKYIAISKAKGVSNAIERVEGSASIPDGIVVFKFPSTDAINCFFEVARLFALWAGTRSSDRKQYFLIRKRCQRAPVSATVI